MVNVCRRIPGQIWLLDQSGADQDLHQHSVEAEPASSEAKIGMKERKETTLAKAWSGGVLPLLIILKRVEFWALLS